ncbi:hypothetical protein HK096_001595, partial [Nowakowskiella sp. JEL0078]
MISYILSLENQTKKALDPTTKFIIGVSFFVLSSAVSSLGLNMQALALQGQRERNEIRAKELALEEELAAQLDSNFDDFSSDVSDSFFSDGEEYNFENNVFVAQKENENTPLLDSNLANSFSNILNGSIPEYGAVSTLAPLETIKINRVVDSAISHTSTKHGIDIVIPTSSLIPPKSPVNGLSSSIESQKTSAFEKSPTALRILNIQSQSAAGSPASTTNRTRIRRDELIGIDTEQLRKAKERMDWWKDFFLKWQWYLGFALYISTQVFGSIVALIFISPMVLAPLGSSGLIFNVLFSSFFLGTRITSFDWFGTLLIVFGCSLVSIFGDQGTDNESILFAVVKYLENSKLDTTSHDTTPQTPIIIFDRAQYNNSVSVLQTELPTQLLSNSANSFDQNADTVTQTLTHAHRYRKASARSQRTGHVNSHATIEISSESILRRASVILLGPRDSSASYSSGKEGRSIVRWARNVRGMCGSWLFSNIGTMFAVVGGIMASETLLLTKSGIELLLVSLFESDNQFNGFISFMILIILILTIYLQLYCLNQALNHSHPVVAIPLFFTVFTCCTLIGSVVYFDTFSKFSLLALSGIASGLGSIVGGVWLLRESQAQGHDTQKKIEEEAVAAALIAGQIDWLEIGTKPIYFGYGSLQSRGQQKGKDDISSVLTKEEHHLLIWLQVIKSLGPSFRGIFSFSWSPTSVISHDRKTNDSLEIESLKVKKILFDAIEDGTVYVIEGSIPHTWLFPKCLVVVHHGGAGTSQIACLSGIPSVVIPHISDQLFMATLLKSLGVSPDPVEYSNISVKSLFRALYEVISKSSDNRATKYEISAMILAKNMK